MAVYLLCYRQWGKTASWKWVSARLRNESYTLRRCVPHLLFDGCKTLINKINDGLLEYNTDGLIFTVVDCGGIVKESFLFFFSFHTMDP